MFADGCHLGWRSGSQDIILKVYIINSITKSYILNIKIRPLVTEYALMIKLVDGTSSAHSFNPYAFTFSQLLYKIMKMGNLNDMIVVVIKLSYFISI
jgi:hypothetical protein